MLETGKLSELLLRWEDLRHQGQTITAEELCRDFPQHLPEIQRQIEALRAVYQVVETNTDQAAMPPRQAHGSPTEACDPSPSSGFAPAATFPGGPVIPGYEILEELGRGGMGIVHKARQIKLNRLVALKMILAGDLAGEQELARFRIEAEAVARLKHPNIVQIHEIGETVRGPFFSLEFVDGGSLDKKIKGALLPHWQTAQLMETLARAMDVAHQHGIIHRDLKPQNILLTADGQPKITDFGLAKRLDQEQGQTQTGAVMGTPSYMAPEQAAGKRSKVPIGPAADVYALGAILYELLTGRPPFKADTPLDTMLQVLSEEPVAPSRVQPRVPRDLETVCLKCLQKEPAQRYGTARELAEELRRFQEGEPVLARPVGRLDRALRWVRRHPAKATAVSLACLVLVLGGLAGVIGWLWQRAAEAQAKAEASLIGEIAANKKAQEALKKAQEAQEQLVRFKYMRDVDLAYREVLDENRDRGQSLLQECPVNLRGWEWRYVRRLAEAEVLKGHTSSVTSVSFSPDGRRLASGSYDETVRVWDLSSGQAVTLKGHTRYVESVSFSPDGRRLASGSRDTTVRVWDLSSGQAVTLEGHTGAVHSVSFSPDGRRLASGSYDTTVRVWDLSSGQAVTLKGHTSDVNSVSFSPDGRRLASGSSDSTVRVWDLSSGQAVTLKGHTSDVNSVSFSPDGRRLASGSHDNTVRVWDLSSGQAVTLKGHTSEVRSVSFSPDGRRLASGSQDNTVRVWDLSSGQAVTLKGHTSTVMSVSFSPDGRRLASGSSDNTVRVWDLSSGQAVTLKGHTDAVRSVSFSPDGRRLASGSRDTTVRVWDLSSGQAVTLKGHTSTVMSVSFSPDGRRLASGSVDYTVRVWDLSSGQAVTLEGHTLVVMSVSFSPDGRRLASGSNDETVRVWDLSSGQAVTLKGHTRAVNSVSFSPDGRRLASGSQDKTLRVWDLSSGQAVTLKGHTDAVTSVSFSPDGRRLASGSQDKTLRVWDLSSGQAVTLKGHTGSVWSVSFSPDGRRLASDSYDNTVWVWDLSSGQAVTLKGHTSAVTSVSFSPDGRRLASGSADNTVRVWEAMDTRHLGHLREATVCENDAQWFAAAFYLRRSIAQEKAKLALEALSGGTSPLPLGAAVTVIGLRSLEDRADLGKLQERLRTATAKMEEERRQAEAKEGKAKP